MPSRPTVKSKISPGTRNSATSSLRVSETEIDFDSCFGWQHRSVLRFRLGPNQHRSVNAVGTSNGFDSGFRSVPR